MARRRRTHYILIHSQQNRLSRIGKTFFTYYPLNNTLFNACSVKILIQCPPWDENRKSIIITIKIINLTTIF
jgi:hypothetical protein